MELDYSQLQTYQYCPQRYYLKYVLGLKKREIDESNIDRAFGESVHNGLASYYKGSDLPAILGAFDEFEDLPPEVGEMHKTKENGKKLLTSYVEHYLPIDKEMEILAVEEKGSIDISGINWICKIDTIVRLRGNIYVLEHKTTKNIRYNYFASYNPNTQVSSYTEYVKQKYGQCSGCIINVLQTGFRQRAYRGEPAGFYSKFQREIVNRTAEQLEDFKENVALWVKRMGGEKDYGKNEGACHQFRGCEFKELCLTSKGIEVDGEIVDVLYEKGDPFGYLKEGE